MALTPQFNLAALQKDVQERIENRLNAVIQTFRRVGEGFVVNVRTKIHADPAYREALRGILRSANITEATPRYEDDTGALTSSVGFLIVQDGNVLHSDYEPTGEKSPEGVARGQEAAREIAALYPGGIILVVVAGMQYAAAVESKGYDVLTGSSFIAERELRELMQPLLN